MKTRILGVAIAALGALVLSMLRYLEGPAVGRNELIYKVEVLTIGIALTCIGLNFLLRGKSEAVDAETRLKYAGFGQRLGAMLIDALVLFPLALPQYWLFSHSKIGALAYQIPLGFVYVAYSVYCHGRWGQTVGKRVAGIKVVRTDGNSIGWRQAWLRSSVDIAFAIPGCAATLVSLNAMPDSAFSGMGWLEFSKLQQSIRPMWSVWLDLVANAWIWSEIVVMLFNRRRRALHDFLAGTIVNTVPKKEPAA